MCRPAGGPSALQRGSASGPRPPLSQGAQVLEPHGPAIAEGAERRNGAASRFGHVPDGVAAPSRHAYPSREKRGSSAGPL